jgi:hypothetical protein
MVWVSLSPQALNQIMSQMHVLQQCCISTFTLLRFCNRWEKWNSSYLPKWLNQSLCLQYYCNSQNFHLHENLVIIVFFWCRIPWHMHVDFTFEKTKWSSHVLRHRCVLVG